jgi:hypothetical protein
MLMLLNHTTNLLKYINTGDLENAKDYYEQALEIRLGWGSR